MEVVVDANRIIDRFKFRRTNAPAFDTESNNWHIVEEMETTVRVRGTARRTASR
jgi:hypothetical protein